MDRGACFFEAADVEECTYRMHVYHWEMAVMVGLHLKRKRYRPADRRKAARFGREHLIVYCNP